MRHLLESAQAGRLDSTMRTSALSRRSTAGAAGSSPPQAARNNADCSAPDARSTEEPAGFTAALSARPYSAAAALRAAIQPSRENLPAPLAEKNSHTKQ